MSSTSALIFRGCGVIRRFTFLMMASRTPSVSTSIGLPSLKSFCSFSRTASGSDTIVCTANKAFRPESRHLLGS